MAWMRSSSPSRCAPGLRPERRVLGCRHLRHRRCRCCRRPGPPLRLDLGCRGRRLPGLRQQRRDHRGQGTAASFFVRLYKLSDYPPGLWFDESNIGLMANRILELPSYRPVFIGDGLEQPGLHFLLVAASMYLFWSNRLRARNIPTAAARSQ